MDKSESIVKISVALLKAQRKMENATKGSSNPFFKSKFADLNAVREASHPVLNEEGITVLQPIVQKDCCSFVRTLLLHESGEYLTSDTQIVVAKANDPQAQGSAISYARRYGLQSFLSLGADDDDGEKAMGRSKQPHSESTPKELKQSTEPAPASEPPQKVSTFRKPKQASKVEETDGWE